MATQSLRLFKMPILTDWAEEEACSVFQLSEAVRRFRGMTFLFTYLFGGHRFGGLNAVIRIEVHVSFNFHLLAVALRILLLWHDLLVFVSECIFNLYFICGTLL
jgi:hypothetical protein